MRPQDIDKIANIVVGSLSGSAAGAGLLGCGSVSSTQDYELNECEDPADPFFACNDSGFQCGGLGLFTCCVGFDCLTRFVCPGPALFNCGNSEQFMCYQTFECAPLDTFEPTAGVCGLPPLPG